MSFILSYLSWIQILLYFKKAIVTGIPGTYMHNLNDRDTDTVTRIIQYHLPLRRKAH